MNYLKNFNDYLPINEFLYTVNSEKTINYIEKKFGDQIECSYDDRKNGDSILIKFNTELNKNLEEVNKIMYNFGWFPTFIRSRIAHEKYSSGVKKSLNSTSVIITYDAKYNEEIKLDSEGFLYHLTPDISWDKISKYGLTPKTQNKIADHPERIYFIEKLNILGESFEDIANTLLMNYYRSPYVKEMYLLLIDLSKLNKNIKFFKDPNFLMGQAVWTTSNIPPNAIEIYEKIKMR